MLKFMTFNQKGRIFLKLPLQKLHSPRTRFLHSLYLSKKSFPSFEKHFSNFSDWAHKEMRAKNFPFSYEDGPRAVMDVK